MATQLAGEGFVTLTPTEFQFEPPTLSDKFPTTRNVINFSKDSYNSNATNPMIVDIPYQAGAQMITDRSFMMFRLDINTPTADQYVGIDEYSGGMPFRTVGIQVGETSSTVTDSQKYADYTLSMIRKTGPGETLTSNTRTLQATELYEPDATQSSEIATTMLDEVLTTVVGAKNNADNITAADIKPYITTNGGVAGAKITTLTKEFHMKEFCSKAILGGDGKTVAGANEGRWIMIPLRLLHPFFSTPLVPLQYFGQAKTSLRLTMELERADNVLNFWRFDADRAGRSPNAYYTITNPKICIEFAETDPSFNKNFSAMVENKGLPLPFSQYDVQEVSNLTDAQSQSIIIEQGHASVNYIIFGFVPNGSKQHFDQPNSLSDFGNPGLREFYLQIGNHRLPQSNIHVGSESVMELLKIFNNINDVFTLPRFVKEYSQLMTQNQWTLPADVDATKFNRNCKLFGINLDVLANQLADFSGEEMLSKQSRLQLEFNAGSTPSNYDLFVWVNHDRVVKVEENGLKSVE